MLDTLKQPQTEPMDTTQKPSVTFDSEAHAILATVIVSATSEPNRLHFNAPAVTVPGSGSDGIAATWDILWTLVAGAGLTSVEFTGDGILIPAEGSSLPSGVLNQGANGTIGTSPVSARPDQWMVTIKHKTTFANAFNYTISAQGSNGAQDVHDPTIALVKDPIDG